MTLEKVLENKDDIYLVLVNAKRHGKTIYRTKIDDYYFATEESLEDGRKEYRRLLRDVKKYRKFLPNVALKYKYKWTILGMIDTIQNCSLEAYPKLLNTLKGVLILVELARDGGPPYYRKVPRKESEAQIIMMEYLIDLANNYYEDMSN